MDTPMFRIRPSVPPGAPGVVQRQHSNAMMVCGSESFSAPTSKAFGGNKVTDIDILIYIFIKNRVVFAPFCKIVIRRHVQCVPNSAVGAHTNRHVRIRTAVCF